MTGIAELFAELTGDDWEQLEFAFPRYERELKRRDMWLRREFATRWRFKSRVLRTVKAAKERERNQTRRMADPQKYREQSRRYSAAYRARKREAVHAP